MSINDSPIANNFILPVWVAGAACAATKVLLGDCFDSEQLLELPDGKGSIAVTVQSASLISQGDQAIGIAFCDSSASIDITRGLEIWTCVSWGKEGTNLETFNSMNSDPWLQLIGGYGVGINEKTRSICLSNFSYQLLSLNLRKLVPQSQVLRLEITFPKGVELAERTSNKSFGIVDGLALIGTQAEAQVSASPERLKTSLELLSKKCSDINFAGKLIYVIGENGMNLATKLGLPSNLLVKTGNWLGPFLVAAAENGVKELLVIGYHGKMVKVAGGIFHTHHHLADGRIEVLISLAFTHGLHSSLIQSIANAKSVEDALLVLESKNPYQAQQLWFKMAFNAEVRSLQYLKRYGSWSMEIGSAMFDKRRRLRWAGPSGIKQLSVLGVPLEQ